MIQSFIPMSAVEFPATKTLVVNFIGCQNHRFHNREDAEKALGFPCQFTAADLRRFKKAGYTIMKGETFDIYFHDSTTSMNCGFKLTIEQAMTYVSNRKGSYFDDFKGGVVEIISNTTGNVVSLSAI